MNKIDRTLPKLLNMLVTIEGTLKKFKGYYSCYRVNICFQKKVYLEDQEEEACKEAKARERVKEEQS